jgi:uncharacterized protein with HEPN domain
VLLELDYSKHIGLGFVGMQQDLEELLNCKVDLVTEKSLYPTSALLSKRKNWKYMRDSLGDKARVAHILEAITEIEHYIEGVSIEEFEGNSMRRLATIKQLEIIGEAVTRLSLSLTDSFPEIEWKKIKGLRNILVHEYFGIDALLIWQIVQHDLPVFKFQIIEVQTALEQ